MRRATTATATALLALTLAACGTNTTPTTTASTSATTSPAAPATTAASAFKAIAAAVPTAKLTGTVTAANDPNHLLGRPGQYTSKITFADSRVSKSDASMYHVGDVELGGAVEVFPDASSAQARASYIQAVTKEMPALTEYDYLHGTVLVRVSHYLTPTQATEYKAAAAGLG